MSSDSANQYSDNARFDQLGHRAVFGHCFAAGRSPRRVPPSFPATSHRDNPTRMDIRTSFGTGWPICITSKQELRRPPEKSDLALWLSSHLFSNIFLRQFIDRDKGKPSVSSGRKVMGPPNVDRQTAEGSCD